MEQVREAGEPARVEAEAEAVADRAQAAVADRAQAAVAAREAVLRQDRAVIVSAPNAVNGLSISWGAPVMSNSVPSAERP